MTYEEKAMTHIGPLNRASELDTKLKFSTFENPRWHSLTDGHLTEQHWQPVFLFSKPIVSIHVCCSYIEFSRSKLHKTGDLLVGNWHVNCQHSSCCYLIREADYSETYGMCMRTPQRLLKWFINKWNADGIKNSTSSAGTEKTSQPVGWRSMTDVQCPVPAAWACSWKWCGFRLTTTTLKLDAVPVSLASHHYLIGPH